MTAVSARSIPARATLDTPSGLVNCMPPVPASAHDHAAWMAATLKGRFYLAWLGFNEQKLRGSQSILRYCPNSGNWETVYQKTFSSRRRRKNEQAAPLTSVLLTRYTSGKNQSLFGRFVSPLVESRICSDDEGGKFRDVPADSPDFKVAPAVRKIVAGATSDYALFGEEGRNALRSRKRGIPSLQWTEIPLPVQSETAASSQPSLISLFNERLVLAIDDSKQGFELWSMATSGKEAPGWTRLLARGGQRYSMNAQVFSCVPWKDALYVACGHNESPHSRQFQGAFEILRIYPDASWDVSIGAPRVTSVGLKIPLSCVGPGMNEFQPGQFRFLSAAGDQLLLGTYEDVAGFRLWRSRDGESWSDTSPPELVGPEKVRQASAFQIPAGTMLLLELENAFRARTFSIWLRHSEATLELDEPTRDTSSNRQTDSQAGRRRKEK